MPKKSLHSVEIGVCNQSSNEGGVEIECHKYFIMMYGHYLRADTLYIFDGVQRVCAQMMANIDCICLAYLRILKPVCKSILYSQSVHYVLADFFRTRFMRIGRADARTVVRIYGITHFCVARR